MDFVDTWLPAEPSPLRDMLAVFDRFLAGRLEGARVLDVACGEGYLSRFLAPLGPREVLGIDLSTQLIEIANERNDAPNASFRVGDAHRLDGVEDASVDVVVSQMALMDIADHRAMYDAVRRVLPRTVCSCSRCCIPASRVRTMNPSNRGPSSTRTGSRSWRLVRNYASEGHWQSGASGLRGHVGSYHRTVSTYVNDLMAAGFELVRMEEPVMDVPGLYGRVPRVMFLAARPVRTPAT